MLKHEWNLNSLYKTQNDAKKSLAKLESNIINFETNYKNKLAKLNNDEFLDALKTYENLNQELNKILTYAFLIFAQDTSKGAIYGEFELAASKLQENLTFFELEFCDLSNKRQKELISLDSSYSFFLQNLLESKPYLLPLAAEQALLAFSPTGANAFSRLFDEHLASLKIGKNKKSEEEILAMLYTQNRKERKIAQNEFSQTLKKSAHLLTFIINIIRKDLSINTRIRKYPNAETFRHISNQTTQKSVDSMIAIVNKNFNIVHDYYKIKGEILGIKLKDYDRYAPIFSKSSSISYEDALDSVIKTYEKFSPKFSDIIKKALKEGWVSSHPTPNKRGGAFSHGATPDSHPFVLLNWTGNRRDAFTIAHEFGHMIHQELSKKVGFLNHDTPLTTAETASVFGEMLLFDYLKSTLPNSELVGIYAGKLEDIFATLFRQIVMTNFERQIHSKQGELSTKELNKIWLEENKKMFGKSVKLSKNYALWWSYIPHFIHSPFYCYAYSYGQLLVLALFGLYKSGKSKNFVETYTEFLSSGGSLSPRDLIKKFGFDIDDKEFWEIGINEVKKMLEEFKDLKK